MRCGRSCVAVGTAAAERMGGSRRCIPRKICIGVLKSKEVALCLSDDLFKVVCPTVLRHIKGIPLKHFQKEQKIVLTSS